MSGINPNLNLNAVEPLVSNAVPNYDDNSNLRKQDCSNKSINEGSGKDLNDNIPVPKRSKERHSEIPTRIPRARSANIKQIMAPVDPVQYANTKITELTKKVKEQTVEIESYKTKYNKIQKELDELKNKMQTENCQKTEIVKEVKHKDDFKKLQDRLQHVNFKLMEEKNLSMKLRNNLKCANKILQQELGDILENIQWQCSRPTWRGRAQIIQDLQLKIKDLTEKVKVLQGKSTSAKNNEKEIKLEQTKAELALIKQENENLKKKLSMVNSRVKGLMTEVEAMKNKVKEMQTIKDKDQDTINKLSAQLVTMKESKLVALEKKDKVIKELGEDIFELKDEIKKILCVLENKNSEIEDRKAEIEALHKKLKGSRPSSCSYNNENAEQQKPYNNAERSKLLELISIQAQRIQDERDTVIKLEGSLKYERLRGAKLEASFARIELEHPKTYTSRLQRNNNNNNDNGLAKTVDQLKDKLQLAEETIRSLQTRLNIETFERKQDQQEFIQILQNL